MIETSPPASKPCYVHYHLTDAEHGFLDVCRSLAFANPGHILYFSGRDIAARFASMSKSTAYNRAASLVRKGWLKVWKESEYLPNGRKSATQYRVLSHDEWALEHPNCCPPRKVQKQGQAPRPVQPADGYVHNLDKPVQLADRYGQNLGHNSYNFSLIQKQPMPTTDRPVAPVPDLGQGDTTEFISRFSSGAVKKAIADVRKAQPVPIPGQGESGTPSLSTEQWAERLAHQITGSIGMGLQLERYKAPWRDAVLHVLRRGYAPEAVLQSARYEVDRFGKDNFRSMQPGGFKECFDRMHSDWKNSQSTKQEIA